METEQIKKLSGVTGVKRTAVKLLFLSHKFQKINYNEYNPLYKII